MDKTFAIKYNDMWIGITKVYLTHSKWDKYCFNQKMTPYEEEGRKLYMCQKGKEKRLPLDRPPIYDEITLFQSKENTKDNFEYYMNREYAYNRDKGQCKICGNILIPYRRHCHRINPALSMEKMNKVQNLVWLCYDCTNNINSGNIPSGATAKMKSKFLKYLGYLKF
jgi:RNA-directed DNA polymerase